MGAGGFVKLWRHHLGGVVFQLRPTAFKLFVWLYLRAAYQDGELLVGGRLLPVKRGQTIVGCHVARRELSAYRKPYTRQQYRDGLATLEELRLVTTTTTKAFTLVTVLGYEKEQARENA